jgi:hypothetical protein
MTGRDDRDAVLALIVGVVVFGASVLLFWVIFGQREAPRRGDGARVGQLLGRFQSRW